MPDWDRDGPEIEANLVEAQRAAAEHALARRALTATDVKEWHRTTMRGLDIDDARTLGVDPADLVGEFRGPPKLAGIEVKIGNRWGVAAARVAVECERFFATLNAVLEVLDRRFPADELDDLDPDAVRAVAEAAAWAHSEWVRIHPFANGNGRTSRLIGNAILVRFGLPPVFHLRPRPKGSYPVAAAAAMVGDHFAMASYVVNQLLDWGRAR